MKRALLILPPLLLLGIAVTLLWMPKVQANDGNDPRVFDRQVVIYGRTYSEWSAGWWQWAFSIPVASHPLFDNGDCSVGQSGPVWYLGGKFCQTGPNAPACTPGIATRSCSVPVGKAIYFPITNVEVSPPEEPNWGCGDMPPLQSGSIGEMRKCVEGYVTTTGLEAVLDGRHIRNLDEFRVQSVQFDVTWPADNLLNAIGEGPFVAGTYSPVVDDGYYVMLRPLPRGNHILRFKVGTSQDTTYHLHVQ